jgi:hypothetical protein
MVAHWLIDLCEKFWPSRFLVATDLVNTVVAVMFVFVIFLIMEEDEKLPPRSYTRTDIIINILLFLGCLFGLPFLVGILIYLAFIWGKDLCAEIQDKLYQLQP